MKMIRKTLAAAITLAVSGNVMAFAPTDTPDYNVNFSGATASTSTLKEVVVTQLCDNSSSIDVYELNGSSKNWGVGCVTDTAVTSTAAKVLFRKADLGSGYGVAYVDEQIGVDLIDLSTCGASGTPDTIGGQAVTVWQCTAKETGETSIPDIGTSDVEPKMFVGSLAAGGVDYKNVSNMVVKPLSGLAFGVVVTDDLRNALQAAQGLTVGAEDEANMPSLTSAAIRTLFAGKVKTWNDLVDGSNVSLVTIASNYETAHPGSIDFVPGTVSGDDTVHICRRTQGSGTHAQIASLIMRTNCGGQVDVANYTALSFLKPQVSQGQGSGDMTDCLDNIGDGNSTSYDGDNLFLGKNRWGIGYQSVEKNASLSAAYRFIKIDGYAPTLENIHAGRYYDFVESTMQRRGGTGSYNSTITGSALGDMSADVTAMFDEIAVQLGQAVNLVSINAGSKFAHQWAVTNPTGWLASPNVSGNTPDPVLSIGNPVNAFAHQGENTCQPPIQGNTVKVRLD
jgi:ABC-type phosphate transport system substrate-binding protein